MKILSTIQVDAVQIGGMGYGDKEGRADAQAAFANVKDEAMNAANYRKFGKVFRSGIKQAAWLKSGANDISYLAIRDTRAATFEMVVYSLEEEGPVGYVDLGPSRGMFKHFIKPRLPVLTPSAWIEPSFRGRGILPEAYRIVLTGNYLYQDFTQTPMSNRVWQKLVNSGAAQVLFFKYDLLNEHDEALVSREPSKENWESPQLSQLLASRRVALKYTGPVHEEADSSVTENQS